MSLNICKKEKRHVHHLWFYKTRPDLDYAKCMDICTPLEYSHIKKGVQTNTPLICLTPIKSMPLILSFLPKKKPFLDTYLTLSLNICEKGKRYVHHLWICKTWQGLDNAKFMNICTPLECSHVKKGVQTNTPPISVTPIKSMPLILSFLPQKKPFLDTYLTLSLNILVIKMKLSPLT